MQVQKLLGLVLVGSSLLSPPLPAVASSHREAPMIAEDPQVDNTDVYFFRSLQDPGKVVILANYIPAEEPSAGPNYYYFSDQALYEIHVDRDNDGEADVTFRYRFTTRVKTPGTFLNYLGPITQLTTNGSTVVTDTPNPRTQNNVNPNYNRYQTYTLMMVEHGRRRRGGRGAGRGRVLARNVIVPPNNAGPTTIPNYADLVQQAIHTVPKTNIRTFAGQVDDPFFVDLGAFFDLLRVRPFRSLHLLQPLDPRPDRPTAPDMLSGFNCHTIAMEIPITFLTGTTNVPGPKDPARILGVYASASRPRVRVLREGVGERSSSSFVQVSRLGQPLVNELFIPLEDPEQPDAHPRRRRNRQSRNKDTWNLSEPEADKQFRPFFQFPEPALRLAQLYPALRPVIPNVAVSATGQPSFTGPRNDLLGGATPLLNFAPDLLRLDVSVAPNPNPNRLGVIGGDMQGFPNGRRLPDDVVDIYMRAAAGALVPGNITVGNFTGTRAQFLQSINFGDGVDTHENGRFDFSNTFPFVRSAHSGVLPAHIGFEDPEQEQPDGF